MKKTFMGVKLRRLRAERGLSQVALAQTLGLSPSYLNQLEQNQRPLTVSVLLKISQALGVDVQHFSEDEEMRLVAALQDALADAPQPVTLPELRELAAQMPALAHALLALHRRSVDAQARCDALALRLGGDERAQAEPTAEPPAQPAATPRAMPFEVVRDFFFAHQNHFDTLDRAAEALAAQARDAGGPLAFWLEQRLLQRHGVRVLRSDAAQERQRSYEPAQRILHLSAALEPGQQAFQLGTQLALLEMSEALDALAHPAALQHDGAAHRLARIGLANYFAGALLLPYAPFLQAAESLRYDIDLLGQRFGVGFETVCHRLSTLQRPGAPGVPFFFVRVDRAGNISKRQSATHFHFSRTGGTCPLWNVYEAFAQPGRIVPQLAQMPDGRTYLWVARTVSRGRHGWGSPRKTFSIGLGCDIRHAPRLVYAKGLDLKDPSAAIPIGMGCKVCERPHCPQRAFPYVGEALRIDENQSRFSPYGVA
ncbi:Cro/Cl family transcriptional regulator [Vandammella animalimorsus]|uniref:Cro/Cl family transcriptional regulator n=1 Tax=Vandammella animalimorsus TaxID=2029117 RepID=A0A2A2AQF3_9BURK|nr:short-chain fatty acyl-CoA regulator family protein [Vandammella animalimorsus]PAT39958.1 Cro/Cl family transcriptional regulator [Vandammella animalimorsus]